MLRRKSYRLRVFHSLLFIFNALISMLNYGMGAYTTSQLPSYVFYRIFLLNFNVKLGNGCIHYNASFEDCNNLQTNHTKLFFILFTDLLYFLFRIYEYFNFISTSNILVIFCRNLYIITSISCILII